MYVREQWRCDFDVGICFLGSDHCPQKIPTQTIPAQKKKCLHKYLRYVHAIGHICGQCYYMMTTVLLYDDNSVII